MKIINVNKYYYLRRGAERYFFEWADLLARHGHETVPFAMKHTSNYPSPWTFRFVSTVETDKVHFGWGALRTAGRFLWSFEAARKFNRLLMETKPDLVHLHNIYHQISPSILPIAKKHGLPVVMTTHDYSLLAPNYALFHDGAICEVTRPQKYWRAVPHRCVKGSYFASILAALEMTLHHRCLKVYQKNIDRLIAPSRFMQAQLIAYGWPTEKVIHVPHFIDTLSWTPNYSSGDYVLYVGSLSEEKGVDILVRAAARCPQIPVRIVGDGSAAAALQALAREVGAHNVEFRGSVSGTELKAEYAGARFVVMPAVWYEIFGLVTLEAYASGKPIVASEIGGLAEMIKPGDTGVPVSAGDVANLVEVISGLWALPDKCVEMGRAGRAWVEQEFSPEKHYERMMKVYEGLTLKAER